MKFTQTILAVLVVFSLNNIAFAQPDVELAKTAIPEIQAQIRTTALAFLSGGNAESEVKTNWQGFRELAKLKELANDKEQLVKQLAIYSVIEQREGQWQVMEGLLVLEMLNLKPSIPIRVLAPYLESENPQLREFAQNWFQSNDTCKSGVPLSDSVNYQDYIDYINLTLNKDEDIPTAFIEYIYQRSPERALLVFLRVSRREETISQLQEIRKNIDARPQQEIIGQGPIPPLPPPKEVKRQGKEQVEYDRNEIVLAEHVVSNAIWLNKNGFDERYQTAFPEAMKLLAKLTEHEQWWVRLYVAEIMRQHRELRQPEVLEKLSLDSNELVGKAAKSVIH
jgi:hypothetical protein